jgi:hypothetical protein
VDGEKSIHCIHTFPFYERFLFPISSLHLPKISSLLKLIQQEDCVTRAPERHRYISVLLHVQTGFGAQAYLVSTAAGE